MMEEKRHGREVVGLEARTYDGGEAGKERPITGSITNDCLDDDPAIRRRREP